MDETFRSTDGQAALARTTYGDRPELLAQMHAERAAGERAGADVEPRGRDDHRIDERALHAVEDRRLVTLVDDADRHQQHARAKIDAAREQEVDIRLLQFEFARLLQPLDERVFQLQFADEPEAGGKGVRNQQDEAMEVENRGRAMGRVEVKVHGAGERPGVRESGVGL